MVVLHIDDMLIAGCAKNFKKFEDAIRKLFNFRTWKRVDEKGYLEYCGARIARDQDGSYTVDFEEYINKIKPITTRPGADKQDRAANTSEVRQLRGLSGALQWPATQGCPHLSCSVSMLQGIRQPK